MESRKAKKIAAANGAELAFDAANKIWNLTIVGTSVAAALESSLLKGYDQEELEDEIAGLKTQVPATKTRGRKRRYPQGISWSKGTKGSLHGGRTPQAVAVTLPNGDVVAGSYEPVRGKYFFFVDPTTGKDMGGRAADFVKVVDGSLVVDLTAAA